VIIAIFVNGDATPDGCGCWSDLPRAEEIKTKCDGKCAAASPGDMSARVNVLWGSRRCADAAPETAPLDPIPLFATSTMLRTGDSYGMFLQFQGKNSRRKSLREFA